MHVDQSITLTANTSLEFAKTTLKPFRCTWKGCQWELNCWRSYLQHCIKIHCEHTTPISKKEKKGSNATKLFQCGFPRCSNSGHKTIADLAIHVQAAHFEIQPLFYVPCPVRGCVENAMKLSAVETHFSVYHNALLGFPGSVGTIIKPSANESHPADRPLPPLPLTMPPYLISSPQITLPSRQQTASTSMGTKPASQSLGPRWSRLNVLEGEDEDRSELSFDDLSGDSPVELPGNFLSDVSIRDYTRDKALQLSCPPPTVKNFIDVPPPPKSVFYDVFAARLEELRKKGIVVAGNGVWPEEMESTPAPSIPTDTSTSSRARRVRGN